MSIIAMFRWRVLPERQDEFMRDWESVEERRRKPSQYTILESGFDYVVFIQFENKSQGHTWLTTEHWKQFQLKWSPLKLVGPEWLSMVTDPDDGVMESLLTTANGGLTMDKITVATCEYFDISRTKVESSSKVRRESFVRHVAWWLSLKMLRRKGSQINESEIARRFKRDRTTVIGGINHISKLLDASYILPGPKKYPGPAGKSLPEVVDEIQTQLGHPPPGDPMVKNAEPTDP